MIMEALLSSNGKVAQARMKTQIALEEIDTHNMWDTLNKQYKESHTLSCFINSWRQYAFTSNSLASLRSDAKLTESNFKKAFLSQDLRQSTRNERMKLVRRNAMLKFEKDQSNTYGYVFLYNHFKSGSIVLNKTSKILYSLLSLLLSIGSLVASIIASLQISLDVNLWYRLSFLVSFFIADIIYLISTYKKEVKFEENYSKSIVNVGNLLFERTKEDSEFIYNKKRFDSL